MAILNKDLKKAMKKTYENDNYRNILVYIIRSIGNIKTIEKGRTNPFITELYLEKKAVNYAKSHSNYLSSVCCFWNFFFMYGNNSH